MNDSQLDFHLGRLLDDAADAYRPAPDVHRLQRRLAGRGRRSMALVLGAAAGIALVGGTALAFQAQREAGRLQPASEPSTVTTAHIEHPPFATPPVTTREETSTSAVPSTVKTAEPGTTQPKTTEPKTTEPKTTEPKSTVPASTEPATTNAPTEPTTTTSPAVAFTAYQYYGSASGTPPIEIFYGNAPPGAAVVVECLYGRVEGHASDAGIWQIHIGFVDAPVGTPFQVQVIYNGTVTKFWFTRIG